MARQKPPETVEELLRAALGRMSMDDLVESYINVTELQEAAQKTGPQSKEELWWWFKNEVGVELSRVAVCEGHSSQLDIAWGIYSFELTRALIVMSRGGSKTSLMAWIDYCQAVHFPGWASFTIGPGRSQGDRKYEHLLPLVVEGGIIGGKELDHVARSIATKTELLNGSTIEIALGGSVEQANGPRVPRLHRDEVELMWKNFQDTYKQAGQIPAGRQTRDGRYTPLQIIDTSTMKWAGGLVDTAMQEYAKSIEAGRRPRQAVLVSCIFEAAQENPMCRSVPDDVRRARLIELDRNPDEICDCHTWDSDVWETEDENQEPEIRTLESVCQGRFFRSRGFKDFSDIQGLFQEADRQTWDAEQECAEPSREGAYLRSYSEIRHGIKGFEPDLENGPIFGGVDWGGVDEHSAGLWQLLDHDVEVVSYKSGKRRIQPKGSLIRFDEIFKSGIGNVELGNLVVEMERNWQLRFPGWHVKERYPDNANNAARIDWRDQCGLVTVSYIKKDFGEEVKLVRTRVGGRLFAVSIDRCPVFNRAIKAWRQINGREVHDENCFVAGTLVETECGSTPIELIIAGERVWTRGGLRSVLWAGPTKIDQTVFVELEDGRRLECTRDHRFWTERGWVRACDLTSNDMLLSWKSSQSRSDTRERSSTSAATGSRGRSRTTLSTERCTSLASSKVERSRSIDSSGSASTDPSQTATRSITSILTRRIMRSTTSSASHRLTIEHSLEAIRATDAKSISSGSGLLLLPRWLARRFARLWLSDIEHGGESVDTSPSRASRALASSHLDQLDPPSSARTTASRGLDERVASIRSSDHASTAETSSWPTSIHGRRTVRARVLKVTPGRSGEQVYDLHVDEHHEFFADGVLVHNSHPMAEFRYVEHNLHVLERRAAAKRRSQQVSGGDAVAVGDEEERGAARQDELVDRITITRHGGYGRKLQDDAEEIDDVGAVDSPLVAEHREDRVIGAGPSRRDWRV